MKRRLHLLCALIGLACAAGFFIVPIASADAGPIGHKAPAVTNGGGVTPAVPTENSDHMNRRMNRSNVKAKDDGCG